MITLSRAGISFFAFAFGAYHGVLGLLGLDHLEHPIFALVAIVSYLLGLMVSVMDGPGLRLKGSKAIFSFIIALTIPFLMAASVAADHRDNHSTWYVAGVATLMAVIALRQHRVLAWLGVVFMVSQVLIWGGLSLLFNAGIFGALMLVAAAHAAAVTLASSGKAAEDYREQSVQTSAETAAKSAARIERQLRVEQALSAALPILNKIEKHSGNLNPQDRKQALVIEAMLRDQIRGRHFDTPLLLSEISKARERGIEVQVLDDGGLDQLSESEREQILTKVAEHVAKVTAGKLVLRSVADEKWTVSITASKPDAESPDLFIRL